ncbi:MAG: AAA family ATPase [Methylorubrum rhodinum]|uniref:AAA family ATPase n=1 Tax=Methylorubrum rhodinum TaxID=29428 RepID=UPI003BB20CC1
MTLAPDIETLADAPRMFSAAEYAGRELKPRPMFVEGLLPGAQVSTFDGDGGAGKTTCALQMTASAVTGRNWFGRRVQRGPAIFLASEDDSDELHRRLDAICVNLGVGLDDLADLHVWPLATEDPALVLPATGSALVPTARWSQLLAAIDRIRPVVLVLDSKADVFGGNEIDRGQARAFVGMLRKVAIARSVAIVILGHPSLSGMSSGSGSSGSTHWRNAVRAGLYLRRPDDEDAPPDRKILELKKANYSATGATISLRWSAGCYVAEDDVPQGSQEDQEAAIDDTFLRLLDAFTAEGRAVGDTNSIIYAPKCFAADPRARGVRKAALKAAMGRLFAAGIIRVELTNKGSRHIVRTGA